MLVQIRAQDAAAQCVGREETNRLHGEQGRLGADSAPLTRAASPQARTKTRGAPGRTFGRSLCVGSPGIPALLSMGVADVTR